MPVEEGLELIRIITRIITGTGVGTKYTLKKVGKNPVMSQRPKGATQGGAGANHEKIFREGKGKRSPGFSSS